MKRVKLLSILVLFVIPVTCVASAEDRPCEALLSSASSQHIGQHLLSKESIELWRARAKGLDLKSGSQMSRFFGSLMEELPEGLLREATTTTTMDLATLESLVGQMGSLQPKERTVRHAKTLNGEWVMKNDRLLELDKDTDVSLAEIAEVSTRLQIFEGSTHNESHQFTAVICDDPEGCPDNRHPHAIRFSQGEMITVYARCGHGVLKLPPLEQVKSCSKLETYEKNKRMKSCSGLVEQMKGLSC